MSEPSSWSNNPNAPQIPYELYFEEKTGFIATLIGSVFYGIVVTLFFQCMTALLNPVKHMKASVKWGLVAHVVVMFSLLTIAFGIDRDVESVSFIDNREFPPTDELPPGPVGYQATIWSDPSSIVTTVVYPLNQWLADGLLLYRCYVIYSMNYWIIAFPCLIYLGSVGLGIAYLYGYTHPGYHFINFNYSLSISYYSVSLSLNALLTIMIIVRLVLHGRNIRKVVGASAGGTSGLYTAIATMLVESYALYAVTYTLFIGLWAAGNNVMQIFSPILSHVQVIAPFLIILRVADRRALTSEAITEGKIESIRFKSEASQEVSVVGDGTGDYTSSMETSGETSGERGHLGAEDNVEEVPL